MIMKKRSIASLFLCAALLAPAALLAQGIPTPVRIVGTLTVDGVQVPGSAGDRYDIEVTDINGNPYTPAAEDEDGLGDDGFYLLDVPVFDASTRPGGARLGDTAVIHVAEDGTPLTVISPVDGEFMVERPTDAAMTLDLVAERETQANVRPVASASGPGEPVMPGDRVVLDGGDSFDPDPGDILAYRWAQITNAALSLSGANGIQAEFTVPQEISSADNPLIFELTVTDTGGLSHSDRVEVTVVVETNQPPVADAGPDQTVRGGDRVDLDGSGSADPDGQIAAYGWEQIDGPMVELTDADTETPFFTAPEPTDGGLTLRFRLTVADDEGSEDENTVTVTVSPAANVAPVAMADADRTVVEEGDTVTLDAAGSSDPDGFIDGYQWRPIGAGPEIALSNPHGRTTTFVAPSVDVGGAMIEVELTVADNEGLTDVDAVDVTVRDNGIVAFPEEVLPFWTSEDREMGLAIDNGEIVDLDSDPQVSDVGAPDDRIYGEVAMEIVLDESGSNADFTLYLPEAAPEGHRWYRYRAEDGWKTIDDGVVDLGGGAASRMARSNGDAVDGARFRMVLADGGEVDSDRTVNGRFSGTLTLGAAGTAPAPDDEDLDHGNSGETNNCFISSVFAGGGSAR